MKSHTIAVIALVATVGPAFGQARRSERPARETAVRQQVEELEARYHEMLVQLSRLQGDRTSEQARALEEAVRHLQMQLHDLQTIPHQRMVEEVEALDRALREQQRQVIEFNELAAHVQESRHGVRAALEFDHQRVARATEEVQSMQRNLRDRLEEQGAARNRQLTEALERSHANELLESLDVDAELDRLYRDGPRASWAPQDPADSVWRAARDLMNRGDYDNASRLFARIHSQERYRASAYRADALYWHAFALNRIGTPDGIRQSLALLERLTREYTAEDRHADTNGLLTTVQVRLAERGNTSARQQVRATAVDEVRITSPLVIETAAIRAADAAREAAAVARSTRVIPFDPIVTTVAGERGNVLVQNGVVVIGTDRTWGLPPGRLNSLSAQCARDESEIQLIALNSLVRMDTAAAMPVLREVMARRDECAAPLRQSAMTIIGRIRNQDADGILADAATDDPDTGVRRTALVYLSSRNESQAVGIAEQALRTADTNDDRQWALQALSRMRSDRAWTVVRDYAARADVPAETRRSAIAILSGSNDSTNTAFLRGLYTRVGNDRTLKEAILMSSAFRRGAADPDWLLTIARDAGEDVRIREFAVTALSRNRTVETPQFVALYDSSDDKRVKLALVRVLSDRANSESVAVDKLISIARTESDADLRKTAVMGLPTNDPRARELLLAILRGT
jgi:TolA-binding protein